MKCKLRLLLSLTAVAWLVLGLATLPADAQSRKRGKKTEQRVVKKKSRQPERSQRTARTSSTGRKRQRNETVASAEKPKTYRRERRNQQPEPTATTPTLDRAESKSERKSSISDKKVGWDDKGRPLYEATDGKRYYVNASGSKVYAAGKN